METRANYILIGLVTLGGFVGLLGFLLWFARAEFDRQFDYYDIAFDTVTGLSEAATVRFSGLPVGQVVEVALSEDAPGRVLVRVEVRSDTPVRADSVATIEAQGITGVSFVSISDGSPDAPLLQEASDRPIPRIESGRSVLQTLTEDAPELLDELLLVMDQVRNLLGERNQRRVDTILANLERSSGSFAVALEDFADVSVSIGEAAEGISAFADQLDAITQAGTTTLQNADLALASLSSLADQATGTLAEGDELLAATRQTVATAETFLAAELTPLTQELRAAAGSIRADVDTLTAEASAVFSDLGAAGRTATARLAQAEQTLDLAGAAIVELGDAADSIDGAATRFDTLLAENGEALVADARATLAEAEAAVAAVGEAAETRLPALIAEIEAAAQTAQATIARVGADASAALGDIDGLSAEGRATLAAVRTTFTEADATLTVLEETLAAGQTALAAAEGTFTRTNRILDEEIEGVIGQLGDTLARLETAIAEVADDVPAATAEVRAAAESASATFAELETTVDALAGPAQQFAAAGLPEYTRLAQEARGLVDTLERLVRQIERDPARFFLDRQSSEFRR